MKMKENESMDYESIAKKDNPFEGLSIEEKRRLVVYFCYVAQPVMTMDEIEGKWGCVLSPDERPTVFDAMQMAEEIRNEIGRSKNVNPSHQGGCFSQIFKFAFYLVVIVLAIIGGITVCSEFAKMQGIVRCSNANTTRTVVSDVLGIQKTAPIHGEVSELTLPGGEKIEMIYCAPSAFPFLMGSPVNESGRGKDESQHRVTLTKGFWLSKYKVTQAQWIDVMGVNPSETKGFDLPVAGVSWIDCSNYVAKINAKLECGARLPTEAEWEYACREACIGRCGFVDMQCGMMEWCNDWYNGDYSVQSVTDPQGAREPGDEKCRIVRGGSEYPEDYLRGPYSNGSGGEWKVAVGHNSRAAKRFYNRPTYKKVYYVKSEGTPGFFDYRTGYWLHGALTYPKGRKVADFDIGFRLCCDSIPET